MKTSVFAYVEYNTMYILIPFHLIFFKIYFSKKIFQGVSNSLCISVSPDMGPNCLQRVSTDDKSQELDINP